jgi:hypothetical protein
MAAIAAGTKVFFAGGRYWNSSDHSRGQIVSRIDVYDIESGHWTQAMLKQPREFLAAAASGDYVMFAGGNSPVMLNNVKLRLTP